MRQVPLPVLGGRVKDRLEELIRAKADGQGWQIVALEVMPDHVHLFVRAHRNTSRTCARCGHCAVENRVTQAAFACTACGHTAHADVSAAINILRAGLALRDAAEAA
ncbi:zinc ribbon domain-containing protein [Actinomadura welshii]|uniref:zinc ribbon domain-containing protein n=1 Tax=Actinomadura welshii TaxID=3103817 RepID=UPI0003ACFDCB